MTAAQDITFAWDDSQQEAINRACDMQVRIVPVTGIAGTGKTTIMREVYTRLADAGYGVVMCAPTGKAAKRIQEATGIPAMTIHRLLEYPHPGERDPVTGKALLSTDPRRHKDNPLAQKVVLADEYAMVGQELHRNLIHALPSGGRLVMFGDVNQLKPIEHGGLVGKESPFEAGLRRFNGITLTSIHRQEEGSGIAENGTRILAGQIPRRLDDFVMKTTDRPVDVLQGYVIERLHEDNVNYGTNEGQIISPTRKSWVGTYKLNIMLQGVFNHKKNGERLSVPRYTWGQKMPISIAVGDKVIWTQNMYDLRNVWDQYYELVEGSYDPDRTQHLTFIPTPPEKQIMNGESGIITGITEAGDVSIDVGDRVVEVPYTVTQENAKGDLHTFDPRRDIDLGYCITTHKSQGSEWENIIYVLNRSTVNMQDRHNFYTAISRARSHVCVVSDQRSIQNAVFNKYNIMDRQAMLKQGRTVR